MRVGLLVVGTVVKSMLTNINVVFKIEAIFVITVIDFHLTAL